MQDMTQDEIQSFLMNTARTGKLATVRSDARPHVAPIWYIYENDKLYFNTWHTSVKGKNIQRDGQVSICVDEETPPFSFVIIEGIADVIEVSSEELVEWAGRIGARYMGDERKDEFGQRNGVEGELLICVTPTKIIAKKNLSD